MSRHGKDYAAGIGAGFNLANDCMSALCGLELCGYLEATDIKDCIELCPVSTEEGGEEAPGERAFTSLKGKS